MPSPRWAVLPTLAFLAFLTYLYLPLSPPPSAFDAPGITHIVMFKWKDTADEASIAAVSFPPPSPYPLKQSLPLQM